MLVGNSVGSWKNIKIKQGLKIASKPLFLLLGDPSGGRTRVAGARD